MARTLEAEHSRRHVVQLAVAGGLALPCGAIAVARAQEEEMATPTEDLMREHGVLERALLI